MLDYKDTHLEGQVYIASAGSTMVETEAIVSIFHMWRRPGDSRPHIGMHTKGYETREAHTRAFLESDYDFILHLDSDMKFPPDTLERLRSHGLPCVSGLYYRRSFDPMLPIWYEDDPSITMPMMPFRGDVEDGRLYPLGATGAGCWLIHRSVYEAVERGLGSRQFWEENYLYNETTIVGADIRLGYLIRKLGFTIWGDPGVKCGHYVHYPLGHEDWIGQPEERRKAYREQVTERVMDLRGRGI